MIDQGAFEKFTVAILARAWEAGIRSFGLIGCCGNRGNQAGYEERRGGSADAVRELSDNV